jgi:hypothetical protein
MVTFRYVISVTGMRRWGLIMVGVALLAVIAAAIVGTTGLVQNPVQSSSSSGTTTITGTFEPYTGCVPNCVEGYVTAGARSVFVIFPTSCPEPARGSNISVQGVLDPTQGSAAYRIAKCV